jgi:hypothetical protein
MPQSRRNWLNQLDQLQKKHTRKRRTCLLWVDARDTPADIEAKRNRLIAAGRASPDDEFVQVRWKRPGEG